MLRVEIFSKIHVPAQNDWLILPEWVARTYVRNGGTPVTNDEMALHLDEVQEMISSGRVVTNRDGNDLERRRMGTKQSAKGVFYP